MWAVFVGGYWCFRVCVGVGGICVHVYECVCARTCVGRTQY